MYARARPMVFLRPERFGVAAYVSDRDDIFLLDDRATRFLAQFGSRWKVVSQDDFAVARALAEIGLLDAKKKLDDDVLPQQGYSGTHLVGDFADIPLVSRPLLVNCFSTSWCPLRCVYCHADDLMSLETRTGETPESIVRVAATAAKLSALVYVITGGDPLSRPKRAMELAKRIPEDAGVVIDTSGVGKVRDAVELLKTRRMHMRVSIDSMDPRINLKTRPTNKALKEVLAIGSDSSLEHAIRLIEEAGQHATGITVQTVISSKNDKLEHLLQFRDWLISRGVRNWVLHFAVNAGAARRFSIRSPEDKRKAGDNTRKTVTILPDRAEASRAVRRLLDLSTETPIPIDIRCTDAGGQPNSVFLVDSEGGVFTQGRGQDGGRKVKIYDATATVKEMRKPWTYVGCLDHVQRYVNFVPSVHGVAPAGLRLWNDK